MLPAGTVSSLVSRQIQGLINRFMSCKPFTVIVSNRLDTRSKGVKSLNKSSTDLIRTLSIKCGQHCIGALSFNQCDDTVLVPCPNDDVAFPVTNVEATLNRFWSNSNGVHIRDLIPSITETDKRCASASGSAGSAINDRPSLYLNRSFGKSSRSC
jgi:hypothetical protein